MKNSLLTPILVIVFLLLIINRPVEGQDNDRLIHKVTDKIKSWKSPLPQWDHIAKPKLDSVRIRTVPDKITFYFSPGLSYYPFREESCLLFIQSIKKSLGRRFRKYQIEVATNKYSVNQLIPNLYRKETMVDSSRLPVITGKKPVLVKKVSPNNPLKGLSGNSVALWHSHGYYYEMNLDRWEWQRARLFGTVEDVAVMGYIVPYLTKMLENSGAIVYLPRERDTQIHEVIVDNDKSTGGSELILTSDNEVQKIEKGFMLTDTLFPGYNPFTHGTSLRILKDSAVYIPEIPEKGYYAIYVSYPVRKDNSPNVRYTVSHTGGKTEYIVNQTIGGETWIYLGTFQFNKGKNISNGSVTVKGATNESKYIALDAIRFGGGLGNVARRPSAEIIKNQKSDTDNASGNKPDKLADSSGFKWKLSGKPRFLEAARYYLQYAGMPDSMVYSPTSEKNDYIDDYQSRGNWVNYLLSNPYGAGNNSETRGLGLPVDLSLALHTDAGVTLNDSVIGTLAIYSTAADNGRFPDGSSRMASRDLSDIIQTEVTDDIRKIFDPEWTRRGLWDKPYSEAKKPIVPSVLLELLSHQNLADQRYGLDPRFRFHVCRAIYKGILKYLSYVENREFVVQPLPVNNLAILPLSGKRIKLSWEPVTDKLEPTSKPDKYIIYKRTGENGFDNGTVVDKTSNVIELESYDTIYSFKVTAINAGGESFDSEILSAGIKSVVTNSVMVVNGFDRISGPEWFDTKNMAGIAWWKDRGVGDHTDMITVGDQYDFNRKSEWLDDDAPGWGASYSDMAGKVIPGNSFDYPFIHGKAIMAAGHSFYSVSDEYFCSDSFSPSAWKNIDLIFGEEKSTPFIGDTSVINFKIYTPEFMQKINELTQSGANIFMSGSYIGSDLVIPGDSTAIKFADKTLHFLPRTGHAVKTGEVYTTDYARSYFNGNFDFNTNYSDSIYSAEAPDAIEPSGKGAMCSFRYAENNSSAGVSFWGKYKTIILGFPFETIISEQQRNILMKQVLNFFEK
jgi:hypothetical protein